jgi:hypothetical protein
MQLIRSRFIDCSHAMRGMVPALALTTLLVRCLQVVDMPESIHDHCSHVDVFNEVNILRALAGVPGVCQMYDFGISRDAFCIVLRDYPCNLLEWRRRQPKDPSQQLRLYVRLFQAVCNAMQVLPTANYFVVHVDCPLSAQLLTVPRFEFGRAFAHTFPNQCVFLDHPSIMRNRLV